jgi:hypothetical protein
MTDLPDVPMCLNSFLVLSILYLCEWLNSVRRQNAVMVSCCSSDAVLTLTYCAVPGHQSFVVVLIFVAWSFVMRSILSCGRLNPGAPVRFQTCCGILGAVRGKLCRGVLGHWCSKLIVVVNDNHKKN